MQQLFKLSIIDFDASIVSRFKEEFKIKIDTYDTAWRKDEIRRLGITSTQQIIFYNPADLAAVARGEAEPWQPQPYAVMNIDEYLHRIESGQQLHHVDAAAFDRDRGLLYVFEPLVDEEKPLVHVWKVEG